MTKQCICQICTCGRHKCPHNATNLIADSNQPCTYSEYANEFKKHELEARQNFKPNQVRVQTDAPLDDKTTNRVDYIEHNVKRPLPSKQVETYQKPDGEMDTMTNYHQEYTKKSVPMLKPIKQADARKLSGKFNGEATYSVDYRKWETQPRERRTGPETYEAPSAPFDGASNYQADFAAHPVGPRVQYRPVEGRTAPDGPFDGATNYTADYVKHPHQPREQREKLPYQPNCAKMEGDSNYRHDFTTKQGDRAVSYKPQEAAFRSENPFDADSTHKADYLPWQTSRTLVKPQHQAYTRPEENMDCSTTTSTDYTRKTVVRMEAIKPQTRRPTVAKFDGTTNYQADYLKWNGAREPLRRSKEEYCPTDAPFDGSATYQVDYVQHQVQKTRSLRPADTDHSTKAPLDGSTEYKKEFGRKFIEPCPALPLIDGGQSSGFTQRGEDGDGHRWFNAVRA